MNGPRKNCLNDICDQIGKQVTLFNKILQFSEVMNVLDIREAYQWMAILKRE
jgi:hypothetical protein